MRKSASAAAFVLSLVVVFTGIASGDAGSQSAELVSRLNEYRTASGLPTIVSDPLVAQAALNHSNYWTSNADVSGPLGLHEETPGAPGFTGRFPPERCAAAGSSCNGEVMAPEASGAESVDFLLDTVYHRQLLLAVSAEAAGGAWASSGMTTIDVRSGTANPLTAPAGFPVGLWSGPVEMLLESPDPTQSCNAQSASSPVNPPVGTPVTWQLPSGGQAFGVSVRELASGQLLPGCADLSPGIYGSYFIPAEPLAPGAEYEVALTWIAAPLAPAETATWRFRTSSAPPSVRGQGASYGGEPGRSSGESSAPSAPGSGRGGQIRVAPADRLISVQVRRHGKRRKLIVRIELATRSAVTALLYRHRSTLLRKTYRPRPSGLRTLVLHLPRLVHLRRAKLLLSVRDEAGRHSLLRWRFR